MTQTRTPIQNTPRTTSRASSKTKTPAASNPVLAPCSGLVVETIDSTACWVTFPNNPHAQAQRASVLRHVGSVSPGQSVLLQFLSGEVSRPVVTGVMEVADSTNSVAALAIGPSAAPVTLEINGQTLLLSAHQRITLRCGKSSLVMNADGNIEIRGTELLSRASGQNAVRGASVSLN